MPERGETEVFSNPLPPQNFEDFGEDDEGQHLTNEDFRKMLMTPRVSSSGSASSSTVHHGTKPAVTQHKKPVVPLPEEDEDDPATRRRKKKIYYANLSDLKKRDRRNWSQNTETGPGRGEMVSIRIMQRQRLSAPLQIIELWLQM